MVVPSLIQRLSFSRVDGTRGREGKETENEGEVKVGWLMDGKERRRQVCGEAMGDFREGRKELVGDMEVRFTLQVLAGSHLCLY